jgi:glucose/arabinose dehydrogenase
MAAGHEPLDRPQRVDGVRGHHDLVAGGLSGANVDRLRMRVEGGNAYVAEREELVHGMGRVRDVVVGPDGTIYVVLNGPDKVVRLAPG